MTNFGEEFISEKAYEKFVVTLWANLKGRTLIMSHIFPMKTKKKWLETLLHMYEKNDKTKSRMWPML